MVTYEQKVARMRCPADISVEIGRAKAYIKTLKQRRSKADCLAKKLEADGHVTLAEGVLRKLHLNVFDLEDKLSEG